MLCAPLIHCVDSTARNLGTTLNTFRNGRVNVRPTIRDVAKRAGVAPSTVSLALNGDPRVSPDTRERVLKAAEELGYRPSTAAKILGRKKSRPGLEERYIGIVFPSLVSAHSAGILAGIEAAAFESGYMTLVSDAQEDVDRFERRIERHIDVGVVGLIVVPVTNSPPSPIVQELLERDFPVVVADRWWPSVPAPRVLWDDYNATKTGVRALIEKGYWPVACAHADQLETTSVSERVRGYQDALKEAGIAPLPELQKPAFTASDLVTLHEKSPRVPAVFAIHDYLALEIWGEALEAGLTVPGSLGIMGFGGFGNVFSSAIPINTVVQDLKAMGREAFRLLRSLIERPSERPSELPPEQIVSILPCQLLDQLPAVRGRGAKSLATRRPAHPRTDIS